MTNAPKSITALLLLIPIPAFAYMGPGAGMGAIGALVALIAAVFFTFLGFVWFPLKRLIKKINARKPTDDLNLEEKTPKIDSTE